MRLHQLTCLNDALIYLCQGLVANSLTRTLGDNCLIVGSYNDYARISLVSPRVQEQWTTLLIEIYKDETRASTYEVHFAGMANAPNSREEFSNPALDQGGYIWANHGGVEWYNFRPTNLRTNTEVMKICEFHNCLKPTSRPLAEAARFR